jgi:REase_DpnII-MboI
MINLPAARLSQHQKVITESEQLEGRMARFQEEPPPSAAEIAQVRREYREWHTRARRLLSGEAVTKFDEHRNGGMINAGVQKFLDDPREESVLKAEDGSFPLGRWQVPFSNIRNRMEKQRSLIDEGSPEETAAETVATDLAAVLRRFPQFLLTLQRRRPDWPIGEAISDESELQVVVEAFLRTLFDDVRPEDYVPSKGGANSRVDFVLPEVGVVVETKMTRASLTAGKLGEELMIDQGRYPKHPDCQAILAFVYDPDARITNPRGVERDLTTRTASGLSLLCVIV